MGEFCVKSAAKLAEAGWSDGFWHPLAIPKSGILQFQRDDRR